MGKRVIGVDFGVNEVKFVVIENSLIKDVVRVQPPKGAIKDGFPTVPEVMIAFLKKQVLEHTLKSGFWALSLSHKQEFTRTITIPKMSISQLELNIPYEFNNYIDQGKDQYMYDYAVIKDYKGADKLDLMICAALKNSLLDIQSIFKQAGLKLKRNIPVEFAYRNLIRQKLPNDEDPICFIDLGHESIRVYIFKGGSFEIKHEIDIGGSHQDLMIANFLGIDTSLVHDKKRINQDAILEEEMCLDLYRQISLEIMKVVNFYNYDTQSSLERIYAIGGGALNTYLIDEIESALDIKLRNIAEILPKCTDTDIDRRTLGLYAQAIGAAWQQGE